jgi:ParB-like chromosome segregation protein Spo0J
MKTKNKVDFSANPENIEVGDWVVKENDNLIGQVDSIVPNKGDMLQFWVIWFDYNKSGIPTPELASNLQKVPKEENGYVGKEIAEGLITSMRLYGKNIKYQVTTELGTPRIITKSQIEKSLIKEKELPSTVNIYELEIDYHLQMRVKMDSQTIEDYADAYQEGLELPPITVFVCADLDYKVYLVDGFHRVEAAKFARFDKLPCNYIEGTYREALMYSLSVNSDHGLKRSNADKRKAVFTLLEDKEWSELSSRDLAKIAKVSHQYIQNLRKEINAKEQELKEKQIRPEDAIKFLDEPEKLEPQLKVKNKSLPPDVRQKNKKLKTYTIEINESTKDKICKRLQIDEELITAEGVINDLLDRIEQLEKRG